MEDKETAGETQASAGKISEEELKYIDKINRKVKHIVLAIKIFAGAWLTVLAAIIVLIIVDGATPKTVYLLAILIWSAALSLAGFLTRRYVKKLQRKTEEHFNLPEDALLGGKKTDKQALKPAADPKKLKDKVYYILTGIAFFGDALAVAGVALLASQAKVHPAVTVILILAGALILTVFHIAALVRFFRRKSAAEQKTIPLTDLNNKKL